MVSLDETALICDLAETYQVYDMRALPLTRVAALSVGLRADSRIKMRATGQNVPDDTLLLAAILDGVHTLVWMQTADGQKGRNRPASVYDRLAGLDKKSRGHEAFASGAEFDKARAALLERGP